MGNLWYTYGPYVAHKWETYGSVMLTSGKPMYIVLCWYPYVYLYVENQWVINPYFYQVWVTYGTKN